MCPPRPPEGSAERSGEPARRRMVRGPCPSAPHLTPFVARSASDRRCFPSVRRLAPLRRPRASPRSPPSVPRNACRPEGRRRVPAVWPRLECHGQARGELRFDQKWSPRGSLPFPSRCLHRPRAVCSGVALTSLDRLFQIFQRGAPDDPRSGSASDRRLQPTDCFFQRRLLLSRCAPNPSTSPTGFGNRPVLRGTIRFGGSSSRLGAFSTHGQSLDRTSDPPSPRRVPCPSPSLATRFVTVPRCGLDWFPHGFA